MKPGDWIIYRPYDQHVFRGTQGRYCTARITRLNLRSVSVANAVDSAGDDALTRWVMRRSILATVPETAARAAIHAIEVAETKYRSAVSALTTEFERQVSTALERINVGDE